MKSKFLFLSSVFAALLFLFSAKQSLAAACCGGGSAVPSLITGDDKFQFTSAITRSKVLVESIDGEGVWHQTQGSVYTQQYKFDLAYMSDELWQAGVSVPVITKSRSGAESTGLADVSLNVGYEILPEYEYSSFKPKGLGYLQVTLPTGVNINEDNTSDLVSNRGRGLWAISAGLLLTKNKGAWDAYTNLEIHRSMPKSFTQNGMTRTLNPGMGYSASAGLGFNTAKLRFGPSLLWYYEDATLVSGYNSSSGTFERYVSLGLSAAYMINDELSCSLNYSDQSLIGAPANTSLSQSLGLQLQKRWPM